MAFLKNLHFLILQLVVSLQNVNEDTEGLDESGTKKKGVARQSR